MSRIDQYSSTETIVEHDNKIRDILGQELPIEKEDKVVIADLDSLIYLSAYTGKDEEGNKKPEYLESEYEIAEGILSDNILKILNKVEEYFTISHLYICIKGTKKNFRKLLYGEYKANRPPCLPIINHLCNYLVEKYDAIRAEKEIEGGFIGYEADDTVYSISKTINHQGIILFVDGDLLQIPSIFYNYQKDIWMKVDEKQAQYNLCLKLLQGDNGDNVKVNKGLGPKTAEKIIHKEMSNYQYTKSIYSTYIKYNGQEKAKPLLKQTYQLLKLHDIEKIKIPI